MNNLILYVLATPIGNLDDITLRAIKILKEVDLIFSEDTRVTRKLLNHLGIKKELLSLHKFNEKKQLENITSVFNKYKKIALLSDAGTPLVSDPGAYLVNYAYSNKIKIIPIPGPSSLTTVISISGFTDNKKILFLGFLPHKINQIKNLFKIFIYYEIDSIVFYESAKRIKSTLSSLLEIFFKAQIIVGREMTKIFEEYIKITDIKQVDELTLKGEFTVIAKLNHKAKSVLDENDKITKNLATYLDINQKIAYKLLMKLKKELKYD